MARRRKSKDVTSWGWRLGGVVLCGFFALGVMAGGSPAGRVMAGRFDRSLATFDYQAAEMIAPVTFLWRGLPKPAAVLGTPGAVAIVERGNGFYALSQTDGLVGPISPQAQGDLPVLSGAGVQNAPVDQLLHYASILVRAEATLSELISEMRVDDDNGAVFFLARSQTTVAIDLDSAPIEIERASELLERWRAHRQFVAALDLTTPGQAVMRLRGIQPFDHPAGHIERLAARSVRRYGAVKAEITVR
ncbi:MAG: hypothetical protein IVW54_02570 [Candidatus Binataceae bacterium]|nr:hypothetical protein [Candidatus Binataceae bacterium]